jgi:L-Ala-D/L-Glu epimerase
MTSLALSHRREAMRFHEPFRISGYIFEEMPAVIVTLSDGMIDGRGEAEGVYYLNDDPAHMEGALEKSRKAIEAGIDRHALRELMPPGGARNAVDCALWELESLRVKAPVWELAGVAKPRPLVTVFTLAADDPAVIQSKLGDLASARSIKLKLDGNLSADTERVRVVRDARPDVWLGVDANQGYSGNDLDALVTMLVDANVSLLEQPVARGNEAVLDGWRSPVPLAADESILCLAELEQQYRRFDVVNIKLDKCGGLTEGLMMVKRARQLGLKLMVGNMGGSTLSTAPAFVLAQSCDIVDLDGPWSLVNDPLGAALYSDGLVNVPSQYWGYDETGPRLR